VTAIPLRPRLLGACSNLPGRRWIRTWIPGQRLARKSPSRTVPIRSCSRWGLPCRLRCRRRGALLPHLFTLTAPALQFPEKGMTGWSGGPFSVALSLGLHPPDVIRHRMSMEPGLSSRADLSAVARAAVRPTDRGKHGEGLRRGQDPPSASACLERCEPRVTLGDQPSQCCGG
jgi:hypothetical protein